MTYDEIEEAHEAYRRCAERNTANPILSGLHDRLARLIEKSLRARDHTPGRMDHNWRDAGEIIPVQEWMATSDMTQPMAQRCERNGSIVPKETVVETVRRNLAELCARCNDEKGLSGGVTRPSEPGPTAVANEAAPIRQTQTQPLPVAHRRYDDLDYGFDYDDLDYGSSYYDHANDDDDEYKDNYEDIWDDETTWEKGSTTTPTTETSDVKLIHDNTTHFLLRRFYAPEGDPRRRSVY